MRKLFINDKLLDADKAAICPWDSGLLYGAGLFETMRASNGVVFALDDHLDRLFTSSQKLAIYITQDKNYLTDAVYETLHANNLNEARLRLSVTAGPLNEGQTGSSTLLIAATEYQPHPADYYRKGVLTVLSPFKQNPDDPTHGHKTLSYFPRILALNQARLKKAVEAIWFTTDHRLAEACISNVFLVKNSKLFTPPTSTPVLPGIARKHIFNLARQKSIDIIEKDLHIQDVLDADEMFLTNTVMQVIPVNALEKHIVADGKPGPLTRQLAEQFKEAFDRQCSQNETQ